MKEVREKHEIEIEAAQLAYDRMVEAGIVQEGEQVYFDESYPGQVRLTDADDTGLKKDESLSDALDDMSERAEQIYAAALSELFDHYEVATYDD